MTIKLYEQEGYQTTFHAHVVSCIKKNELYDIILDQTLFFPEEGGQTCDKGTLNGIEIHFVTILTICYLLVGCIGSQFGVHIFKLVRTGGYNKQNTE